jgi:hypothetical protein
MCFLLYAQTPINSQTINGQIWTVSGSPYQILGDITVENLNIQPGVTIEFIGNHKFEVSGYLIAKGSYSDSIIFRADSSNSSGWAGLKFRNGSSVASEIVYCRIEDAIGQGLWIEEAIRPVYNCRIVNNRGDGIHIRNNYVDMKAIDCSFNTLNGIKLETAQLSLTNSVLSGNSGSGIISTNNADSISLINTVIADNIGNGYSGGLGKIRIINSIIFDNSTGIVTTQPNPDVTYSNIQDSIPGAGNIYTEPEFSDQGFFNLSESSPCIDAGDSSSIFNDLFFPPSQGESRNDMGIYGGPYANLWYPPLMFNRDSFYFGKVTIDSTSIFNLNVKNYRNSGVTVENIFVSGPDSQAFSTSKQFFYLPFLGNTDLLLTFKPDQEITYMVNLILKTSSHGFVKFPLGGEGVIARLNLLQSSLNFGDVSVNDSSILGLPIQNLGSDTLRIQVLPPSTSAFSVDRETLKIPANSQSDTLFVKFKPDSTVLSLDSLIILSNDPQNLRKKINLSGNGLAPTLTINPSALNFGSVPLSSDSSLDLTLYNTGNDTLFIDTLFISQQDTGEQAFTIASTGIFYPVTILPASDQLITLNFKPQITGDQSGQLHILSNDPFQENILVELSGLGLAPILKIEQSSLDFGSVPLLSDSSLNLSINNLGNDILFIDTLFISQQEQAFEITDTSISYPVSILPASDKLITLKFKPQHGGSHSAQFHILSNDPFQEHITVPLSGTGLAPQIAFSSLQIHFGQIPLTTDSINTLTIYNTGSANLIIYTDSLNISGKDSTAFSAEFLNGDSLVSIGDSIKLSVRFYPTESGPREAFLHILSNDPDKPQSQVLLTGLAYDNLLATILFDSLHSTNPLVSGQPATLSFTISSPSRVDSSFLYFRQGGKSDFMRIPLANTMENNWAGGIISTHVSSRGLEYYVCVYHGWTMTQSPEAGTNAPEALSVNIPLLQFPDMTKENIYQMISIPFSTGGRYLNVLFSDDLGTYDDSQYRFFNCINGSSYVELKGMNEPLSPGKAIWLITREPVQLDVSNGQSVLTNSSYTIQLRTGWNMIATPFNFPINWTEVSDSLVLRFYDGTSDWPASSILEPFKGYAVHSTLNQTISIPPHENQPDTSGMQKNFFPVNDGWHFRIIAEAGRLRDGFNFAGVLKRAQTGVDRYDLEEPPPIADFIQVYFHLKSESRIFSSDFRNPGEKGYRFRFTMSSNLSGDKILTVRPENLPSSFDWTVVSGKTHINYGKKDIKISLESSDFDLIVGLPDYVQNSTVNYSELPSTFKLEQNYPNPFNPSTSIKYQLPEAGPVTILVFNILGQKVKTLMNNTFQDPGYFRLEWDGTNNNGQSLSSGIYFLQLKAGPYSHSLKMILQK